MSSEPETPADRDVTSVLETWRQGDCSLEPALFIVAADTTVNEEADDVPIETTEVHGLVVITQTCDIVQDRTDGAYVQVAPLVEVDDVRLREIARRRRVQYAYVPGVAGRRLVADLARIMTVTRETVARWTRVEGCRSDDEHREFAQCVSRRGSRTAFPNDFVILASKLRSRILAKHARETREGEVLRDLWDIRIVASPDWDAEKIELLFYFICEGEVPADGYALMEKWLALVSPAGRYVSVVGRVATLDDLTAKDYVTSDPLDFEHLSGAAPPE